MKKLFLSLTFLPFLFYAQTVIKGVVTDAETGEPLPFANVYTDKYHAVITDYEGKFRLEIPADAQAFQVSYLGYETQRVPLEKGKNYYQVKLRPSAEQLDAVEIATGVIPLEIKLLRRAVARKKENNYLHKLKKFAYTKYIKLLITANPDEIDTEFDTIHVIKKDFDTIIIDSSLYELKQEVKDKHLWLYQALAKVNGINGKEKSKVIAVRTAGLKKPVFEFLAVQISNQNLYDDYYQFLFSKYLGPFSKRSEKTYEYEIEDTVKIQGRDVIALAYRNTASPPVVGTLYLDKESLAIARMTLNTYKQIQLNADYRFRYFPEKDVWFPDEVDITMKIAEADNPFISLPDFEQDTLTIENGDTIRKIHSTDKTPLEYVHAVYRMKITDVRLDDTYPDKIRYAVEVDPKAHKRDSTFWMQYAGEKPDEKELNTYRVIDSLAERENLEYIINRKKKLFYGYIPLGKWIDWDFFHLMDYNLYEGFRVNLALQTSEFFSETWQFSGYAGYGFKDKVLKYGGKIRYRLAYPTQTYVHIAYRNDLFKAAAFSRPYGERSLTMAYPYFADNKFYAEKGITAGLSHLLRPTLKGELTWTQAEISPLFYLPPEHTYAGRLQYFRTSVLWTPFSEYELTPLGRLPLKNGFPVFYLTFEKNLSGDGIPSYYRADLQVIFKKVYLNTGYTDLVFRAGYASPGAPPYKLYAPNTNNFPGETPWKRFTLVENFAFETMYDMEFLDNFITTLHVAHTFKQVKIIGNYKINIRLSGSAAYGFTQAGQFNPARSLDKGYYETGIEFQELLDSFGLGVYYRMGPYQFPHAADNLSIRLTLSPFQLGVLLSGGEKKK